jgi:hypothetical protein
VFELIFSYTTAFNVVPVFLKAHTFFLMIDFCAKNGMFELILPQLKAIDLLAAHYQFSNEDHKKLQEKAIASLQSSAKSTEELNALYKILLNYIKAIKDPSTVVDKVVLLYQLSVELFSVSQYNELKELEAYKVLKSACEPMYELVEIFAHKELADFDCWVKKSKALLTEKKMLAEQLRKKLGMLLLCELNSEEKTTYKDIAKAIDVTANNNNRTQRQI